MKIRNFLILCKMARIIAIITVPLGLMVGIITVPLAILEVINLDFEQANQYVLIAFAGALISCFSWHLLKLLDQAIDSSRESCG